MLDKKLLEALATFGAFNVLTDDTTEEDELTKEERDFLRSWAVQVDEDEFADALNATTRRLFRESFDRFRALAEGGADDSEETAG